MINSFSILLLLREIYRISYGENIWMVEQLEGRLHFEQVVIGDDGRPQRFGNKFRIGLPSGSRKLENIQKCKQC